MYFFALLALVASASAEITIDAPCPAITPVSNFNFAAYAQGTWYEVGRYPNNPERGAECGWAEYTLLGDEANVKNYHLYQNKIKVVEGTHKLAADAGRSGKIIATLPYGANGAYTDNVLNILAHKNDDYIIGYYCSYDETKKSRRDFVWILSRSKTLSYESKAAVDKYLKESDILSFDNVIWPSFQDDDCKLNV